MLNINFGNKKPVNEFVNYIRDRMKVINTSWVEISQALLEAREMYGSDSYDYKAVLKETKFAKSTANKFIAIASSERLKTYSQKLSAVNSWATLYAIHSMSDDKFTALVKSYKLDQEKTIPPFITLGNVNGILKEKVEQDPFKIFAKIRIDEDALKGDLIDGVMLTNIEELLKQLETSFPYLKIERSGIDEKVESKYFNKVQQKKAMLERQLFSTAIAAKLKNKNKIKGQSQSEFETRYLGMSRQELSQMFFDDPKSAFEYIGYEYDENKIYNDALKAANEWVDSIAQKVHERTPDPFKVANSTMLAA